MAALDATLVALGSNALHLPWHSFPLLDDNDHFTKRGQHTFHKALVAVVGTRHPRILVLADSTIGYYPDAPEQLRRQFALQGVDATVDAICGSGFAARAIEGYHFRARWRSAVRNSRHTVASPQYDAVLVIGGWNDVHHAHMLAAARGFARDVC